MPVSQTASLDKDQLRRLLVFLELGLCFACLVMFSEGLLPRLLASEENPEGSPLLRLLWLPVYGLVLAGCAWKLPQLFHAAIRLPFLMLILALAAASVSWSIDPAVTQRRVIAITATTLAGLFLAVRYDWRTLLRLLGCVWLTLAFISFFAGLIAPGFAVHGGEEHAGAWRGLWWQKNALGGHMARAAFLCGFLLLMDRPWRLVWAVATLLCTVLVIFSTSKTALLGLLLGFGVLAVAAWMRRGVVTTLLTLWAGIVAVGTAGLVLLLEPELVFQLLGRDATLTGRTDIWSALVGIIEARPLFGYGYGAFWDIGSEPAYQVRLATEWLVPTAHNGWLETALSIGLVGLAGLVLNFILVLGRSLRLALSNWTGVFALGVLAQFFLFSMSESIALQQNAIVWVTYVAVAAKVALSLQDNPQRHRRALLVRPDRFTSGRRRRGVPVSR